MIFGFVLFGVFDVVIDVLGVWLGLLIGIVFLLMYSMGVG